MTIASSGYTGTVTQEDWAVMAQLAGCDNCVAGQNDLVVAGTSGTRVVTVSAGTAWGWGVVDILSGTNTVTLAANGTGAPRWDAIVLRRNWTTGATTLAAVTGGASEVVPSLTVTPGVQADQVLALVQVPAGATNLTGATVRRLVQWPTQGTTGAYAPHSPSYGQEWTDLATGLRYRWNGSAWSNPLDPPWTAQTLTSGLASEGITVSARALLGYVELKGRVLKQSGSFAAGWSSTLFTLPAGLRPPSLMRLPVAISGPPSPAGQLEVTNTGAVRVYLTEAGGNGVNLTGIRFIQGG